MKNEQMLSKFTEAEAYALAQENRISAPADARRVNYAHGCREWYEKNESVAIEVLSKAIGPGLKDGEALSIITAAEMAASEIEALRKTVASLTHINEDAAPDLENTSIEDLINAAQAFICDDQSITIRRDDVSVNALQMQFDCKLDEVQYVLETTQRLDLIRCNMPF